MSKGLLATLRKKDDDNNHNKDKKKKKKKKTPSPPPPVASPSPPPSPQPAAAGRSSRRTAAPIRPSDQEGSGYWSVKAFRKPQPQPAAEQRTSPRRGLKRNKPADDVSPGPSTSSSTPRARGRPTGTGIGRYRTEQYRNDIELGIFGDYDFPTGKPTKKGEEGDASRQISHMEEVAQYVVEDMYEQLMGGLIIPEGAPVEYFGM